MPSRPGTEPSRPVPGTEITMRGDTTQGYLLSSPPSLPYPASATPNPQAAGSGLIATYPQPEVALGGEPRIHLRGGLRVAFFGVLRVDRTSHSFARGVDRTSHFDP